MNSPLALWRTWRARVRADQAAFREQGRDQGWLSVKRSSWASHALFYGWDYLFTAGGKIFLIAWALASIAGGISPQIPLYQVSIALVTFVLVAGVFAFLGARATLRVQGHFPEKLSAGQTVRGEFKLTRTGWWPVYDLSIGCFALPRSWSYPPGLPMLATLGRNQSALLPLELTAGQRGLYQLPAIRVFTTFPFNLMRFELVRIAGPRVLVLPWFHPVISVDLNFGSRYQPGGLALTSNIGESPEYIGNRDFQPGDSVRRIDFRSWARLARPVVKEYQEEYYCRIALILDTFIPRTRRVPRRGFADLEAAVSLSATVADALAHGEYILDLFAAGPELHVFRAGRHTAHLENVLELLACVGACRDNPFQKVASALVGELSRVSTLVCVLLDWDAERQALVRQAVEAGCRVKVLIVRDAPTTFPLEGEFGEIRRFTPSEVRQAKYNSL